MTVKIEFIDGGQKCYTNVAHYGTSDGFLTVHITADDVSMTKLIPVARIKFAQVE